MSDLPLSVPARVTKAQAIADRGRFKMSSEPRVGALLRSLVATKPGGRVIEVGGGVGVGAGWLLDGMDAAARLTTIEKHENFARVLAHVVADDPRAEVVVADATEWLTAYDGPDFDFAFIDTTVTKFERRDTLFAHLADGALVVADDLLPQDSWDASHPPRVELFRKEIMQEPHLVPTLVDWASGLVIAAHRKNA
ncbi:class I SAM-dependent methyltransferase [Streptomyces sp. NPDC001941]|uniref:O-methyltransferase n=1 Tax=Streptomyces sp. NPDC001941 TaxID=3154659 RepID=UPI003326AB85